MSKTSRKTAKYNSGILLKGENASNISRGKLEKNRLQDWLTLLLYKDKTNVENSIHHNVSNRILFSHELNNNVISNCVPNDLTNSLVDYGAL